jgi:hypothetical protein
MRSALNAELPKTRGCKPALQVLALSILRIATVTA